MGEADGSDSEEEGLRESQQKQRPWGAARFHRAQPCPPGLQLALPADRKCGHLLPSYTLGTAVSSPSQTPWLVNLMVWELPACGSNGVSTSGQESLPTTSYPPTPPPPATTTKAAKGPPSGSVGVSSAQTRKHAAETGCSEPAPGQSGHGLFRDCGGGPSTPDGTLRLEPQADQDAQGGERGHRPLCPETAEGRG